MKFSLSEREKNLLIILAVVVGVAVLYYFFFNNAIQKWADQRVIYLETAKIQEEMLLITERGPEIEKNIEVMEAEAGKLAKDYYYNYTAHMAEQRMTEYIVDHNLSASLVKVFPETSEALPMFRKGDDKSSGVNALRIPLNLSATGSFDNVVEFVEKVFNDKGMHVLDYSISGAPNLPSSVSMSVEIIIGSKGVI